MGSEQKQHSEPIKTLRRIIGNQPLARQRSEDPGSKAYDDAMAALDSLEEQLNAREPDYAVFHEWCVENMPKAVELCPYKFPKSGLLEQLQSQQEWIDRVTEFSTDAAVAADKAEKERDGLKEQLEAAQRILAEERRWREETQEQLQSAQRKVDAYDRARSTVKIKGNTRAEYVLGIEALQEQYESRERELFGTGAALANADAEIGRLKEQLEALQNKLNEDSQTFHIETLKAKVASLEEQLEALERVAPIGRESEMEAAQRRRADALQEQLEALREQREDVLRRLHAAGVAYDPQWDVDLPTPDSSPASEPKT